MPIKIMIDGPIGQLCRGRIDCRIRQIGKKRCGSQCSANIRCGLKLSEF